jgi:signal transduction histidine kinase
LIRRIFMRSAYSFSGAILLVFIFIPSGAKDDPRAWSSVQKARKGEITVYWYESKPFIYRDQRGRMSGIEPEIMDGFVAYLWETHKIRVSLRWVMANSFGDIYDRVRRGNEEGIFGVSAFSITPERQREVGFSPPYMTDISVLISSNNIPIVNDKEEFNRVFSNLTAITITRTTYEQDLLTLKKGSNLDFKMTYIPSSQNILRTIEGMNDAFGFIDLPVYMMIFNDDPSVGVKRQNLFPVKRQGYSFMYPLGSDWAEPIREYFESPFFKKRLEPTIGKYIDIELYRFVESLAIQSNDPVILLTKEKEIQERDLIGKARQITVELRRRNYLIGLVTVTGTLLFLIVMMYRKRNEQKKQIEVQRRNIELKRDQLEKRNQHLIALDEEKNNLIKILAHDLRTPINHVQGLAQVFLITNPKLEEDQKQIIQTITDSSIRLNKMITNILDVDAIENNRSRILAEDVAVAPIVSKVVHSFEKQAARKRISLACVPGDEKWKIKCDPLFLIQIFENLISNALKFSSAGQDVEVTVKASDGKVIFCVKDHGPGLTEEDQEKLFKKFQRLSAYPTGGEGSLGLGLSIVKKYTELMGGRVWCESKPQQGASFYVEFGLI